MLCIGIGSVGFGLIGRENGRVADVGNCPGTGGFMNALCQRFCGSWLHGAFGIDSGMNGLGDIAGAGVGAGAGAGVCGVGAGSLSFCLMIVALRRSLSFALAARRSCLYT